MVAANGVKLKAWLFKGTQKLCEVLRAADTHVLEIRPKGQRGIFAGVPRRRGREAPPKSAGPASGDERLSEELATPKSKTAHAHVRHCLQPQATSKARKRTRVVVSSDESDDE